MIIQLKTERTNKAAINIYIKEIFLFSLETGPKQLHYSRHLLQSHTIKGYFTNYKR